MREIRLTVRLTDSELRTIGRDEGYNGLELPDAHIRNWLAEQISIRIAEVNATQEHDEDEDVDDFALTGN